jgi:AraC family transcriptional regulator, positive regulator of tynA and feaB
MDVDQGPTRGDGMEDDEQASASSDYRLPWNLELGPGVRPRTTSYELGEPWVTGWSSVGRMLARRGATELRSTPGEFVGVLMVEHGSQVLVQQGRSAHVRAGAAAMWDGVRPLEAFSEGRLVKRTMFIPRRVAATVIPRLESVIAEPLPDSVSLRLLVSWLGLAARQPDMDRATADTVGRMAVELLQVAVAQARGGSGGPQEVLVMQVKDFLDRNLAVPNLTLDDAARANAISLRYLHMLFQGTGETAGGYLRRRRLDRAQALLLGSGSEMSIAEVAWRCGFDSPSSFSRAYRSRFGVAPRDARLRHGVG